MTLHDTDVLNQIYVVTQNESVDVNGWDRAIWKGFFPSGLSVSAVEFLNGPLQGQIILIKPLHLKDKFVTEQSKQDALSYLKRKYEMQSPSFRVTQ
jgi:hypothetical protein